MIIRNDRAVLCSACAQPVVVITAFALHYCSQETRERIQPSTDCGSPCSNRETNSIAFAQQAKFKGDIANEEIRETLVIVMGAIIRKLCDREGCKLPVSICCSVPVRFWSATHMNDSCCCFWESVTDTGNVFPPALR